MEINDFPKCTRRVAGLFCHRCHSNDVERLSIAFFHLKTLYPEPDWQGSKNPKKASQ